MGAVASIAPAARDVWGWVLVLTPQRTLVDWESNFCPPPPPVEEEEGQEEEEEEEEEEFYYTDEDIF